MYQKLGLHPLEHNMQNIGDRLLRRFASWFGSFCHRVPSLLQCTADPAPADACHTLSFTSFVRCHAAQDSILYSTLASIQDYTVDCALD